MFWRVAEGERRTAHRAPPGAVAVFGVTPKSTCIARDDEVCIVIAPASESHTSELRELLAHLPSLYPQADVWLERTMKQIRSGDAHGLVAMRDGRVVGTAIEKEKPGGRRKLSSLYVASDHRRLGIATELLHQLERRWDAIEVRSVYLTCRHMLAPALRPLLHRSGFELRDVVRDRYGVGEDEAIFVREPSFAPADRERQAPRVSTP